VPPRQIPQQWQVAGTSALINTAISSASRSGIVFGLHFRLLRVRINRNSIIVPRSPTNSVVLPEDF